MGFVQAWRFKGCLAAGGRQACVFAGGQRQAGRVYSLKKEGESHVS